MSTPDLQGNDLKSNKLKKISRHRSYRVRQAYQYFASQRWQEALSRFEFALLERPTDAGLYHRKGDCLYNLRRYQEALEAYEQAIRLKSGKRKTKPSLLVCTNKKANALEKIRGEKKNVASQQSVLRAGNSIPSTSRPLSQVKPQPPTPRPTIDPYAAARAAQEHSRKLENWPQGPNDVPMPRPPMTGVYLAGRPQYPNGVPIIGRPQHPNGTPIMGPRFGMKLGG